MFCPTSPYAIVRQPTSRDETTFNAGRVRLLDARTASPGALLASEDLTSWLLSLTARAQFVTCLPQSILGSDRRDAWSIGNAGSRLRGSNSIIAGVSYEHNSASFFCCVHIALDLQWSQSADDTGALSLSKFCTTTSSHVTNAEGAAP
jgi:hypothetical protein